MRVEILWRRKLFHTMSQIYAIIRISQPMHSQRRDRWVSYASSPEALNRRRGFSQYYRRSPATNYNHADKSAAFTIITHTSKPYISDSNWEEISSCMD
jgi:hypothetical protein